ncbi:18545_t:CDS:2, partial [Gigaspora rosea]
EITALQRKSVVENTHKSTLNWINQFENYRKDTNLPGELFNISDPNQLEEELCKYFTVYRKTNGDEYSRISFNKNMKSGNYEIKLFQSKTNQRSLESPGVAETFFIPPIFDIVESYDKYMAKRPPDSDSQFYLHPIKGIYDFKTVDIWYEKKHLGENFMKGFFKRLVESCDIDTSSRKITNQTGRKTLIQLLKSLGLSDYETMSISRHKSQKGLAAYERPIKHVQELGYHALNKAINYKEANESSVPLNKPIQTNLIQNESIQINSSQNG